MQTKSESPSVKSLGKDNFDRTALEELLKRRFFYAPAFSIYGGVKGLYDYGPPGTAIKNNLLQLWRQHFVLEENMLELESTSVTPEVVFKASGHVEKFKDLMVKDVVTGECFRADHLLEQVIDERILVKGNEMSEDERNEMLLVRAKADSLSEEELGIALKNYDAKFPETGNDISDPYPFNLMFATLIGPTGKEQGYLRPEIAQGMFVNFKRLLEYNCGRLPFGAAQIGLAYRNEISPRSSLLRVREFTLAEIEYFVHPNRKEHAKFKDVRHIELNFYPSHEQLGDQNILVMAIGDAVEHKLVANETLGYFLARTQLFLLKVGIIPSKIRFRQHLRNEMAHYACDCWDAEIQTSYGWIECVGHADRSAYDLSVHSEKSGESLVAFCEFDDGPHMIDTIEIIVNKAVIGKKWRGQAKAVLAKLDEISRHPMEVLALKQDLESNGQSIIEGQAVTLDLLQFKSVQKRVSGESITPSVIEPSFGIGRILYCIFEHSYWVRQHDEQRAVLAFKPSLSPIKVSVLPLMPKAELLEPIPKIIQSLVSRGISSKVDDSSATIGRRYARTDEIGVPFGITIDYITLEAQTVTLRERDSTEQVRIPISQLTDTLFSLINGGITWCHIKTTFPVVDEDDTEE